MSLSDGWEGPLADWCFGESRLGGRSALLLCDTHEHFLVLVDPGHAAEAWDEVHESGRDLEAASVGHEALDHFLAGARSGAPHVER